MKKQLSAWGKAVKHAMIDCSWSIADLSEATGLSREYVTSVINERVISNAARKKVSDALNIPDESLDA